MDFYIDGGGGGSTGGVPTGWNTGSPGVAGGGGSSSGGSGGTSYWIPDINTNGGITVGTGNWGDFGSSYTNYIKAALPYIPTSSPYYAYNAQLASGRGASSPLFNTAAEAQAWTNAASQAQYQGYLDYWKNKYPTDPSVLGISSIAPDAENALLAEYGKGIDIPTYQPEKYSGLIGDSSAYASWKDAQLSAYTSAASSQVSDSPEVPKPFMPDGAPTMQSDTTEPEFPKLDPYNPMKSDWNGSYKVLGLDGLFGGNKNFNPFSKLASQYDSPSFTGSGLLAQTMAKGMEGADPQSNSSNPWQSKNLIKPASYFDESSQGIAPPKGLMGQDMITQNNVLPALQMALMNNQGMPEGNEALDAATKPLSDAKDKGNATDKIQEARDKWKSNSLNKLANWQSLA